MGNDWKPTHPAWLLKPTISKFGHPFYVLIILHNLKILLFLLWLSHPTISKLYQHSTWNFFGLVIPPFIWRKVEIVSVLITIASNITVLVSHNVIVIFFGCLMSMSHGINKNTPPSASPHLPSPNQVLSRLVCCFPINTLPTISLL